MPQIESACASTTPGNALQPADLVRLVRSHVHWWVIPAVLGAVVAGVYSFVAPGKWLATQALIIRPEVASVSEERLGKFADLSEMKTSQETVLELARSHSVLQAALREVGPANASRAHWPTALDIEDFRESIDMRPPGGAEFGKTEVFYLTVKDSNRDRAAALVSALCNQLELRLKQLRDQSAQGMIAELERTVAMASDDLATHTATLAGFESTIGADLTELRNLNSDSGNQSEVALELNGIEADRRANESRLNEIERLLKLLAAAQEDPRQLLATPNTLLASQPAVSQLKNALVASQLRTAELAASRSEEHPFVISALAAERSIREQLHQEIAVAIRGLEVERELCADRELSLVTNKQQARQRIAGLAIGRAEYTNLLASVSNHTRLVEAARKNLADARARRAGAEGASIISRIDGVEAGIRPVGLARKSLIAAGGVAGMVLGLGCVFLLAKVPPRSTTQLAPFENVSAHLKAPTTPEAPRPKTLAEAFGMFRGKSLQEAIDLVQGRRQSG
ncbi:MAG: hypothetical protein IT425_00180 [Pirellulales bacterium]|nr:hypothetical protein [Pirellulales bacterium]